jgi:hypothetical protein
MKKAKASRGDLRREYSRADFPGGLVRGKYAGRAGPGGTLVRLDPEIAAAFPTSEAVNKALAGILKARAAKKSAAKGEGSRRSGPAGR